MKAYIPGQFYVDWLYGDPELRERCRRLLESKLEGNFRFFTSVHSLSVVFRTSEERKSRKETFASLEMIHAQTLKFTESILPTSSKDLSRALNLDPRLSMELRLDVAIALEAGMDLFLSREANLELPLPLRLVQG